MILGSLLLVAVWEFCRPRRQRIFLRCAGGSVISASGCSTLSSSHLSLHRSTHFGRNLQAALGVDSPFWPIGNPWVSFVSGFLLLDFLVYAVHRCQHAVPFLWRFHALHHSDPDVDVTTSVRHHPIEYVLAGAFYWLVMLALDIPVFVVSSHALAVFAAAAVTHGNTRLPGWLERILQPFVITLDLHLVHHSIAYDEANANFGGVLSIWDRLFGTLIKLPRSRQDRIVFGVADLPRRDGIKPGAMLMTPWILSRAMRHVPARN